MSPLQPLLILMNESNSSQSQKEAIECDNLSFDVISTPLLPNDFNLYKDRLFENSLSVSHVNIRSLQQNFDSFIELYEDVFQSKFSLIGLSEIWNVKDINQFTIPHYNIELQCRTGQRGGGVGAYVHHSLNYSRINDLSLPNAECLWLKIHVQNVSIIFGVIYRKPGTNIDEFNSELKSLLQKLNLDKNLCIIVGDFNMDLLSKEDKSNYLLRLMQSFGLSQVISSPTRITSSSATLIDHIYTNISSCCIHSGCIEAGISDHLPIYATFEKFQCNIQEKKTIIHRNFRNVSVDSFKNDMMNLNWTDVYDCFEPNEAYDKFCEMFLEVCDKNAPIEEIHVASKKTHKPWITRSIKKSIRKKHQMYSKTIKSGFSKVHFDKYKKYRNILTSIVRTSKKMYYGELFEKDKSNSKKTWKHINELLNKNNSCDKSTKIEKIKSEIDGVPCEYTSPKDIANVINDFFVNIGKKLASKIDSNVNHTEYLNERQSKSFFFSPVISSEVKNLIMNLDQSKACGYDNIPARLLFNAVDYVCEPLTHVFNVSFLTGVFPKNMKIAKVIPIYKKGLKCLPGNYRPISILPIISKVFEKIVNARLMKFLNTNKILREHQYGFRNGYSTKLSLINLINELTHFTDEGRITVGIFIDFAKAFDTIDHTVLQNKLNHYGIRGLPLNWFKNYLDNRYQYVCYDGMESQRKEITCGVPQGSVLGPTLFLLYINDLSNSSSYFKFRLFADDSSLFHTFDKGENRIQLGEVNKHLSDVVTWCEANKLTINVSKTNYMLFKNRGKNILTSEQLEIKGKVLNLVDTVSFIGLNIDEKLNWEKHINNVCNVASKKAGILYRIRHYVSKKILVMLYNAFILPHITYGLEVWGAANKTFLSRILVIQKRITRVILFKSFNHHSAPLFSELSILDVFKQYRLMIATFVHDLLNNKLPHRFIDYFSFVKHPYETRSNENKNITLIKVRTNLGKQSVSYSGAVIWNALPNDIRKIKSRKTFRQSYKAILLAEYIHI